MTGPSSCNSEGERERRGGERKKKERGEKEERRGREGEGGGEEGKLLKQQRIITHLSEHQCQ